MRSNHRYGWIVSIVSAALFPAGVAFAQQQPVACCFGDQGCTFLDHDGCLSAGGIPLGPGNDCSACTTELFSCCLPEGGCADDIPAVECAAHGGRVIPSGLTCADQPCDQPACERDEECADDDPCTRDVCRNGFCVHILHDCDDQNACTKDACDPITGACKHTPVVCDDQDPCTIDLCDPAVGCVFIPRNCDDNDPCTIDSCEDGVCVHRPRDCSDNDPCTVDRCIVGPNGQAVCVHLPMNCNDNDPCTIDHCVDGICRHDPVDCDDNNPCTIDTCVSGSGGQVCLHTLIDCDDNDECTKDYCLDGQCFHDPIPGCGEPVVKFFQPPAPDREDIPSNINLNGNTPRVLVADDFRSDGRPITHVEWWGSYIDERYMPEEFGGFGQAPYQVDGWLISFHRPVRPATGALAVPTAPLGLYFAPREAVTIGPVHLGACDQHTVFQYRVALERCCLIHSFPDVRVPATADHRCPAQREAFYERHCYRYHLGIQAVVGARWQPATGAICCVKAPTNNFAEDNFWGWHDTVDEKDRRPALRTVVSMGTSLPNPICPVLANCPVDALWLYGPWSRALSRCDENRRVNMAFALYTSVQQVPPDCPRLLLTEAVSRKTHSTPVPSTWDIKLPLDPPAGAGVECRRGGVTEVVMTFSEPIMADDGSLDPGDEVTASVGNITGLTIVGNRLIVDMANVPDASCLQLTVEDGPDGITTLGSDPLSGDNDVHAVSLLGDVTGDYVVNIVDLNTVKSHLFKPVGNANFRCDVSTDGVINIVDLNVTKGNLFKTKKCP